ncbi:MAG: hypothetical protein ACOYI6_11780 [Christensenellales bacterium]|jgi:hypothetical protein
MKACVFCGKAIDDDATFCGYCGNRQSVAESKETVQAPAETFQTPGGYAPATNYNAADYGARQQVPPPAPSAGYNAYPPKQQQTPPQYPPQGGGYYPPQPGAPGFAPQPPREPSKLALHAKNYWSWFGKGFLGTKEPMHLLLASIIPFLVTLFFTLADVLNTRWSAVAFFLMWIMNMVYMAALPVLVWLIKRYWGKDETATLESVSAEYSSYHNVILPYVFLVMILSIGLSFARTGSIVVSYMCTFARLLSLGAALTCLLSSPRENASKTWLKVIVIISAFFLFSFTLGANLTSSFGRRGGYGSLPDLDFKWSDLLP